MAELLPLRFVHASSMQLNAASKLRLGKLHVSFKLLDASKTSVFDVTAVMTR